MGCILCTLLDHGNHDPLLDIPKQFLLLVIDTFFGIRYNCLYQLGYCLIQFPVHYSHIVSGIVMSFGYPWCLKAFGWSFYSTQLHLPFRYSPGFVLLRFLVSQLGQSFLVIDLETTVVVLSCWILNYSVPTCGDSSSLLLSLALPSIGQFSQSSIERIQNLPVLF